MGGDSFTRSLIRSRWLKSRGVGVIVVAVGLFALSASVVCSRTHGGCTAPPKSESRDGFIDQGCIGEVFAPAHVRLPMLSRYQRVYWHLSQEQGHLELAGQLVPLSKSADTELEFTVVGSSSEADLGVVTVPPVRYESIRGVRSLFDGSTSTRNITFVLDGIMYEVTATSGTQNVGASALESQALDVVLDLLRATPG